MLAKMKLNRLRKYAIMQLMGEEHLDYQSNLAFPFSPIHSTFHLAAFLYPFIILNRQSWESLL